MTFEIGGPHVVTISGFNDVAQAAGPATNPNPVGKYLFAPAKIYIDLPKQGGTHDFVVPAD